ncbi:hypothetical protein GCM10023116_19030 [Kistimonas scapharcae]|uniref:Uncharacterized protein n=1 Tax=Kistimonas scapharcae TaxID=1036133 RepID=A0ABP8V1C9_9GAMM
MLGGNQECLYIKFQPFDLHLYIITIQTNRTVFITFKSYKEILYGISESG